MTTEIQIIKQALHFWKYGNEKQFNKAEKVLEKYHNKYGTVDINKIRELTKN
tara:strand:+ start:2709 stop:2864 length:156 start_codon:yes stop_codon:yes gene_type:complete